MKKQNISNKILYWYDNNHRQLPWRKHASKKQKQYFTLVSEFMLQQTQVKTVIPFFENFIKNFPNLKSLAKSSEQKILKNWEGLGYYSRARNLKKTAIKLLKEFKGELPKDIQKLKSLPGIGEYTSRSILAIAHNKPYIPMDGNVERILKRVFLLKTKNKISKENLNKKKSFFLFFKNKFLVSKIILKTKISNIKSAYYVSKFLNSSNIELENIKNNIAAAVYVVNSDILKVGTTA